MSRIFFINKFSFVITLENTMNLSEHSVDKELFSGMLVKENILYLKY